MAVQWRAVGVAAPILLAAMMHPAAALAATPPEDPAPEGSTAGDQSPAPDIVVTARRRAESIQTVPLSIQAFDSTTLQERQILRVSDLTQVVPGLTAQASPFGNSALTLAIRGQRQGLANIAYDPAVSVYSDEVVQARSQGLNDAFFDLASVQVLKGPQGTLFGRNTTGGAILITSQAPKDSFGGYADVTLGNYDMFRAEGAINLPITRSLSLRLAGVRTRRSGYLANPPSGRAVDDQRTESWRASLRFAPAGIGFENRLVVSGFNEADSGVAYKLIELNPASLTAPAQPDLDFYKTADFYTTNAIVPAQGTRIRTLSVSNISTIEAGGITIKNIFGFRKVDSSIFFDLDGASPLIAQSEQTTHEHQWSNETQVLGSAFEKQLDYVFGAYFFREDGDEQQSVALLNATSGTNTLTDYSITSETAAAYGQATYKPDFLPHVSFTGGLRYTADHRDFATRSRLFNGTCRLISADVGGVPLNPCFASRSIGFDKLTYTASADWAFAPNNLLYVTRRFGYQAGGFTNSALRPADFAPYRPQTVQDWEVGLKTRWKAGFVSGRANIALFQGDYKDIQRLLRFTTTNPSGLPFPQNSILNAASATTRGIEFDGTLRFGAWVEISAAYTYLSAKYDKYIVANGGTTQDYTNSLFAGSPEHSISGAVRVKLPVPESFARTHIQLDGAYQTKTVSDDTTNFDPVTQTVIPRAILPGFGTINMRLDLDEVGGRPLKLSVFVKNLTKERYYTAGIDSYTSIGDVVRLLGAPRTFGVNARYEF
ncbi:TonB-dependent receptor [Sphingomonas immobilis]|uniref:TonB-dependent receptor n=1 Tax=Sphingomonas immobilis TaxID=3063997 RepID=A0ABT8ZT82_9SPHN|nr:TonB-dependent receptor [Sphingomonas sp. CA1-15]MDO7840773.1 TonB-dependent receptor [Sphingomonas sp. CA1-15]